MALEFNSQFLNDYMQMVEETESPRLFHVWSALSGMSACLGRRCWLPFGPMVIFPNQFVVLVGTPGTRKSTAMSIMKRQLRKATGIRFAPADTAGQRQGLVAAMSGAGEPDKEYLENVELAVAENSLAGLSIEQIAQVTNVVEDDSQTHTISGADKHHIMVTATELSRFIGQNNLQMLDFLVTMWDGEDYEYQTKGGLTVLRNPLINMLSCTTPVSIHHSMPPAAGGQGFLSRMILVYGARKYKEVPRPVEAAQDSIDSVRSAFNRAYYELAGEITETNEARAYSESLYGFALEINDPRFGYYHERRYDHLIKLAISLAASRGSTHIVKDDYEEAHRILRATELGMPDALGEFGMNPLAALKQSILDYLRNKRSASVEELRAVFHRDSTAKDFQEAINDLMRLKQFGIAQTGTGQTVLIAKTQNKNAEDAMIKLLSE